MVPFTCPVPHTLRKELMKPHFLTSFLTFEVGKLKVWGPKSAKYIKCSL